MTAPDSSDGIETTAPPAVSSLRSRFEKLAADSSAPSTSSLKPPASGSHTHLAVPPSPRLRPSPDHDREASDSSIHSLHPASSSSDLKATAKRPPPPPPLRPSSRAPSPANPRISPLLRPVPDPSPLVVDHDALAEPTSVAGKAALLSRRPPPPPPPAHDFPVPRASAVSSLIKQFGNGTSSPAVASPPKPPPTPSSPSRPSSQIFAGGLPTQPPPEPPYSRRPRQSFPPEHVSPSNSYLSPASSSESFDPFDDSHSDTETTHAGSTPPPPLPRRNGVPLAHHSAESSSDSISSSDSSSSSRTSSDNNSPAKSPPTSLPPTSLHPPSSPRPPIAPPPRPPPRNKITIQTSNTASSSVASLSTSSPTPPPLPARKAALTPVEDHPPRALPSRHQSLFEPDTQSKELLTPTTQVPERKQFGGHLPPPMRTIALGDKLPPPRRQASESGSSSEDDDEDEDFKMKIDLLPDASRASRRPPAVDCYTYPEHSIHVPAYTASVATCGTTVAVVSHHHLRIYDLSIAESPLWNLDSKSGSFGIKVKDFKMTSVEFRPTASPENRGAFLWVGTKDGHLIELDVRIGKVTAFRPVIHAHTVTHMFRYGQSMVTCDDTGKVLVFSPPEGADLDLGTQVPRVVRIAEKQEFAVLLAGQLWTSTRDPNGGGSVPGTSKGPYVRVYNVFVPGSVGRSLLPTEHLGAITSGTILPCHPGHVYLAHEGGHVSIWSIADSDSAPQCVEIVKVSVSDILSLAGVNNRLWAGTRKGTIEAFDVSSKPWVVTNSWQAHQTLPVLRISVDTWSMEKLDRLVVFSVGRDERLRFWDGLLGIDWIEQELLKREAEFSTFRYMTALIVSWNVDSNKPEALTGTVENLNFLTNVLQSMDRPDFIQFGFQELIDLESRKMAAKTVLLGGKKTSADGMISQKVSTSYRKWHDRLLYAVRVAMPTDEPYTVINTENLVGLFSCSFVKVSERPSLKNIGLTTVKRGMGGRYGNKGGIISRFIVDDTSVCLINCHLAAGQSHVRQRNADAAAIVESKTLAPDTTPIDDLVSYVNGGDGSMVLDHELVFLNGDMNYRIDQRREAVIAAVKAGDLEHLLIHDQLKKEMKFNRGFRLRTFSEGPIQFAPTYKYDPRTDEYDTSEKSRTPAWCDRVLWRSLHPERVEQIHYRRWEANISDHRPISAGFRFQVKSVQHDARARVKAEIRERWKEVQRRLLSEAKRYYVEQKMI